MQENGKNKSQINNRLKNTNKLFYSLENAFLCKKLNEINSVQSNILTNVNIYRLTQNMDTYKTADK